MGRSRRKSNEVLVNPSDKEQNVDRLSNLPDSVICHILSFLSTKESVATSILARSWRYLWTTVPVLDFDFNWSGLNLDFLLNERGDDPYAGVDIYEINDVNESRQGSSRICYPSRMGSYEVLSRVMILNCQRLNRFRLQCSVFDLTDFQLDTCITGAVARGVKNLVFEYERSGEFEEDGNVIIDFGTKLPSSLFCCKTLVDLSLTHCFLSIPADAKVSLSSLKKLRLFDIKFGDVETLPKLISGCPILEEISIKHCIPEKFPAVKCPPTLVKAKIIFSFQLELWWPHEFLNNLSMVKSLRLWYKNADISDRDDTDDEGDDIDLTSLTSKFNNLIRLEISVGYWEFVFKMLENADFLKHLEVRVVDNISDWSEPPQVSTTLISHLETVEIVQCCSHRSFFPLVSYVLKNARILKKMTICMRGFPKEEVLEFRARISSLELGSTNCKQPKVRRILGSKWVKPELGWMKLNTDGSLFQSRGMVCRFSCFLGDESITVAKLLDLRERLLLACQYGVDKLILECDSEAIVTLVQDLPNLKHPLSYVLDDLRQLLSSN